jgi:putative sugar O-methyltransferase
VLLIPIPPGNAGKFRLFICRRGSELSSSGLTRERHGEKGIRHVIELGAGFGRTAHVLLSVYPFIERYQIVDLPETLALSRVYLLKVLPDALIDKVEFVDAAAVEDFQWRSNGNSTPDLAIQIDGLQEMEKSTIDFYYRNIFDKVI